MDMNDNMPSEEDDSQPTACVVPSGIEPNILVQLIDDQLAHIWMVRTFLKHCDESVDDEELAEVHRSLYDYMLALGPAYEAGDHEKYLKLAHKKFSKLRKTSTMFAEIQPEVSGHMNFKMASKSLELAVARIANLLEIPV